MIEVDYVGKGFKFRRHKGTEGLRDEAAGERRSDPDEVGTGSATERRRGDAEPASA